MLTKIDRNDTCIDTTRKLYCRSIAGDRLSVYTVAGGVVAEANAYYFIVTRHGNTGEGDINSSVFPVSDLVLKSGPQSITIRLYPAMKGHYQSEPFLTAKSGMKIKIKIRGISKQNPEAFKTLYSFETPDFKPGNLPYAEYKGTFEAEEPYT